MKILAYAIALTLVLILSYFVGKLAFNKSACAATAIRTNVLTFVLLAMMVTLFSFTAAAAPEDNDLTTTAAATTAAAAEETQAPAPADNGMGKAISYLAAALAVGLAGIGGGIAVGSAAPAAIGATSEDPKNFGKSLIFVALGEGIALYGLLIALIVFGNAGK